MNKKVLKDKKLSPAEPALKEIKSFPFKMKGIGDTGTFSGYAAIFGNVDMGGDVIERGAFRKTLNESQGKIPILDHHDPTRQIGWNLEAQEDERGLFVRGKLNLDVQGGREKHSLMKQAVELGARMGLSIGFRTIKEEPDQSNSIVRRLKEVRLVEFSVVTFPMNTDAGVVSVKARRDLIDQFFKYEIGMNDEQAVQAGAYVQSLFGAKPENHLAAEELEPLKHSLKTFLATLNEA